MVEALLREELKRTFTTRFGYLLSSRAFRRFRRRVDYSEVGGAPLLGVAGHGHSSAKAVRNAVVLADRHASQRFVERVASEIAAVSSGLRVVEGKGAGS